MCFCTQEACYASKNEPTRNITHTRNNIKFSSFHDEVEVYHCAPAAALRNAFIICDFGCQMLNIEPVEGAHVPFDCTEYTFGAESDGASSFLGSQSLAHSRADTTPSFNVIPGTDIELDEFIA